MTDQHSESMTAVAESVSSGLERMFAQVGSAEVFSKPVTHGDSIIVNAAAIERFGGFGFGAGEGDEGTDVSGSGGGGGGGGRVEARPVAVIRVDDDRVSVVPVFDMTRIVIAAIGVCLALLRAMRRR